MELWNNPSCSKCAVARQTLDEAGIPHTVRDYLTHPPTEAELDEVLRRLGMQPWEVARLGEPAAADLGLADAPRDRAAWIATLVAHPQLIQRPILLLDDGRAVIGRSPETLRDVVERWDVVEH